MRIFYLSNALEESDFALLNAKAVLKPNPAGQNFHNKLLHALAGFVQTEAYSLIPNQEGWLEAKTFDPYGPLRVHYLDSRGNKVYRFLTLPKKIAEKIKSDFPDLGEGDFVLYDSLNIALAKAAKVLSKKYGVKRVAILTDDPHNISGTKRTYQRTCVSLSSNADGYFALTKGLVSLFNKKEAPALVKMGLVEDIPACPSPLGTPYIYYGGALFVKDGTKALIDSYLVARPNIDLVIAGHGPYETILKEKCKLNRRVHFVGQLSKQEHYAYIKNAALLINPRIYSKKLDEVSVPSKVLEYLASGSTILSTPTTPILETYENSINVLPNSGEDPTASLVKFYKEHIGKDGVITKVKPNMSPSSIKKDLGSYAVGKALVDFLTSLGVR